MGHIHQRDICRRYGPGRRIWITGKRKSLVSEQELVSASTSSLTFQRHRRFCNRNIVRHNDLDSRKLMQETQCVQIKPERERQKERERGRELGGEIERERDRGREFGGQRGRSTLQKQYWTYCVQCCNAFLLVHNISGDTFNKSKPTWCGFTNAPNSNVAAVSDSYTHNSLSQILPLQNISAVHRGIDSILFQTRSRRKQYVSKYSEQGMMPCWVYLRISSVSGK